MKTRLLGLIALLATTMSAQGADNDEAVIQKFIGDWELVSYYSFPATGGEREMGYIGRLSYDEFGNMAGLGMPRDLPARQENSAERLMQGFAYWGKVSWDIEQGVVVHHVEGSPMVPQWVGGDNVRHFQFEGDDILRLSVRNPQGRTTGTLTWRRLK